MHEAMMEEIMFWMEKDIPRTEKERLIQTIYEENDEKIKNLFVEFSKYMID